MLQSHLRVPAPLPAALLVALAPPAAGQDLDASASKDEATTPLVRWLDGGSAAAPRGADVFVLEPPERWAAALERTTPPLPAARAEAARRLFLEGGRERRPLAIRLAQRLPRPTAEETLLDFLSSPAPGSEVRGEALRALVPLASAASAHMVSRFLASPIPGEPEAARRALAHATEAALAAARPEEARNVLERALEVRPRDVEFLLTWAAVTGVFLGHEAEARERLTAALARQGAGRRGLEARESVRLREALAALAFFHGDGETARIELQGCVSALDEVDETHVDARLERTRAALLLALLRLIRADDEGARRAAQTALDELPVDPWEPLFDRALKGAFGPSWFLDTLWRRGRTDVAPRFWSLLERTLLERPALGLALPEGADLAPGSERASVAVEQAKSWTPLHGAWTLYRDGRLDEAITRTKLIAESLDASPVWNNRLLTAQAEYLRGLALARRGNGVAAATAFTRARELFRDVGREALREEAGRRRGRPPRHCAPPRSPHAEAEAESLASLADVTEALLHRPRAAASLRVEARALAPLLPSARVAGALADVASGRAERARVVLDTTLRRSDILLPLAHLALALGEEREAEELFQTHLAWNARAPLRAEIERRWWARLRDATPSMR